METNSELEFVYLKSPVIALTCDATLLLKRRWLIAKQSDGGFMETNSELEFVYLKSPVIALRAMPPSFSKRVFLTSFEKGGGAKRRRIYNLFANLQNSSICKFSARNSGLIFSSLKISSVFL